MGKHNRLSGVSVLILEDELDSREAMTRVVEQTGATVEAFPTVTAALDAVKDVTPDVLVVDIGLPQLNGYNFIGRIRRMSDPTKRDLPAIAVTAFTTSADRDTALASGFQLFVPKPVRARELIDAILKAIAPKRNSISMSFGSTPGVVI